MQKEKIVKTIKRLIAHKRELKKAGDTQTVGIIDFALAMERAKLWICEEENSEQ